MITKPITISLETYTTLLDKENLGEPHPTLVGGELWYPPELARERDVRILHELREQGLTSGNRVSEDFHDTLRLVQRPAVEYYTFAVSPEGDQWTARTAMIGRDALLITKHGADIHLEPIPHEQLGVRLAAALPETPPAQLKSITCSVAELEALQAGKSLPPGPSSSDAKRMQRWLDLERQSAGQLYAAIRDGMNRRHTTTAPMPCWIDTESGRLLLTPDGSGWCTLTGGDTMSIAQKLSALEEKLRG
ncbi:ESX secretion-associated protein EspG [Haloechinothrix sp. LS1_15]|uniref:ESX secretion-associated protein EspG n=1 Tax=Haloechinothrix sp. LS1_15 TaxID=2652248 RepID=UPI0029468C93|nr:ESX secretion-associated protein EspG [Haloechinothrix sp. LS1_15]MDV6011126.1 ESX secretion-associated protein EspG [Haloechinothrix sp. LS1_15]